jgi:hypothetical protein
LTGLVTATWLLADFSYEQTSRITGGALAGMMRVAGAFSKSARQPMKSTILLKGDRMATVSDSSIDVIDLGSETFTHIDLEKKQYSKATFAEMAKAMENMAARARNTKDTDATVNVTAEVKPTGDAKVISGMNAKRTLVVISLEGTDKKTGDSGAMRFLNDMWLASDVPGYEEVRDFSKKMAEKLAWTQMGNMARAISMQQPGSEKAMAELVKEMSKLEGVPVLQVMRLGVAGKGVPTEAELAAMEKQAEQPAEKGESESGLSRAGRIGGALGGFGGFGRRKKQEEPPQQQQSSGNAAPAALMEFTTEMTNFSAGPVDASKFEVPSGFKQVEHPMTKAANR